MYKIIKRAKLYCEKKNKTHLRNNKMETPIFQEINGKSFIKIKGEITYKHCKEVIEEKTLKKINYFEVREETEESLRNKVEMLYNKYFLEGITYINEHEEKCMYKEMNELRVRECKISAYRNNQKIYERRN
ncbi:hypothetical protein C1646_775349 [Rhizophagus diaphanus]|nr:hypothetical protein C1646_775349 [Rhizophagus diaphanus] [Rhizophagus sp. MUCL 43196]